MRYSVFIWILLGTCLPPLSAQHRAFSERADDRKQMVQEIRHYPSIRISNEAVLTAMGNVPRHAFVPEELQAYAYINRPLPIGYEQTISQPVIVASMTDLLALTGNENVLEIGTGSGYQAAVLGELCKDVYTIEIVEALGERARNVLKELGYTNVHVRIGDGYEGWPQQAPFDRIIVTCAPENVPQPLKDQLKTGGRMVIPVGRQNGIQYLIVLSKKPSGKLAREYKYPVRFVPMTGKAME